MTDRVSRLARAAAAALLAPVLAGCLSPASKPAPAPPAASHPTTPPPAETPAPAPVQPAPLAQEIPRERRVLVVEEGRERFIDGAVAVAGGYTIIDLSDDWTPLIFAQHESADGQWQPNRYRTTYVGLANDELDEDGQPLPPDKKNHLELYGIPPSFSVLRRRFLESAEGPCSGPEPPAPRRRTAEAAAMAAAERRLACEGFLTPRSRHKAGTLDHPMREAIRGFQQKHMIYEGHALRPRTKEALGRTRLENDHRALLRVLRERVVSAAGIIEDGTVTAKGGRATYLTASGESRPVPDLAEEYTQEAARQLGLLGPEDALAFFRRHPAASFARLRAAVKLPPLPPYYPAMPEALMDLSVVIDRGDVWYDLPFDETGAYRPHARKKFPQFTLFVRHKGQQVPLVRWRTTVGGWRAEQASDGYEYFRYKGSDVGPRVIRQVVAGPVWIAPASTPIRSLVKIKSVLGRRQPVVNYDELGPGFLSAYGLVAGYVVTPGKEGRSDFDNGIRIHGSAEYLSMYSANGFSHGCHRLPNYLALRLYSFLLRRRPVRVVGEQTMDFARQFLRGDQVFEIRIPSRGYAYTLDPPLPVEVLEGEIKGEVKEPILTYVPKPGVPYPGPPPLTPDSPEARAGGGVADPVAEPAAADEPAGETP